MTVAFFALASNRQIRVCDTFRSRSFERQGRLAYINHWAKHTRPRVQTAKCRYMWRDLERICTRQNLVLRRPSAFPRNGLLAARLACCFSSELWLPECVRRVYLANFAEDRDISDPQVLVSILLALGQPASRLAEGQSAEAKARLRSETEQAVSLGIFGAPRFVVGGELFWGNDRLESALSWAKSLKRKRAG